MHISRKTMCKVQVHKSDLSYLLTSPGHGMCAQPGGSSTLPSTVQVLSLGAGPHPQHTRPGPSQQLLWASERQPVFLSLTDKSEPQGAEAVTRPRRHSPEEGQWGTSRLRSWAGWSPRNLWSCLHPRGKGCPGHWRQRRAQPLSSGGPEQVGRATSIRPGVEGGDKRGSCVPGPGPCHPVPGDPS